jgi:hypothetical protein
MSASVGILSSKNCSGEEAKWIIPSSFFLRKIIFVLRKPEGVNDLSKWIISIWEVREKGDECLSRMD